MNTNEIDKALTALTESTNSEIATLARIIQTMRAAQEAVATDLGTFISRFGATSSENTQENH